MKIFAGIALSLSALLSSEEINRPESVFRVGAEFSFTGDFDFTDMKKQKYASSFQITEVKKDGSHWSCNATMTYGFDGVPKNKTFLFQFACDSLNYYVHAQNFLNRDIETIKKGEDETSGDSLIYPLQMKVGDTLPDAWCKIMLTNRGETTSGLMEFTRRSVEALDTLSLPCGKVAAYRVVALRVISSKGNSQYSGKTEVQDYVTMTEWFSPQLGIVKAQEKGVRYFSIISLDKYSTE